MKLTKNIISRKEALKISTEYVAFVENTYEHYNHVMTAFDKLKRGQKVLTRNDGKYILAKVTKVDGDCLEATLGDGPVIRVSNGEYSWRVDGDQYAYPI